MSEPLSLAKIQSWPNLCAMFHERAAALGDKPFLWSKAGGQWRSQSWRDAADRIGRLARGLTALGIAPGDRVVLCSENRPEWLIAELAILSAGAVAVPAYTTNTAADHTHILNNVQAKAAIVSTKKLAVPLLQAVHGSNSCEFTIALEQPQIDQALAGKPVHLWDAVLEKGGAAPVSAAAPGLAAKRDDLAVIIHTSGTGGAPRGVMLPHRAILANCAGVIGSLGKHLDYNKEVFLSFLPLSHAYEHAAGQWLPILVGAEIYYAEGMEQLLGNIAETRPTIMTAVPRLYEVMHQRIVKGLAAMSGSRKKLFDKALALGRKRYETKGALSWGERTIDGLLTRLVRKKVQARFGGRLKFFVSGGAPLNYEVGIFFTALGVTLLQGYGMTEAAPVISANNPDSLKIETVGPPLHGVEVKIAEDGEILVRGDLLMLGYWGDAEATRQVLKEGWLHTGDIGEIDGDGHVRITDRKKDIIVNSGGDNVSPQRVEGFLTLQPEISQAMVYGDKRPHLVAVIVPDPDAMRAWAKANGKSDNAAALSQDDGFKDLMGKAVERVNQGLSNVERVRRFLIAPDAFTTENGMLTPSLKIRRHVIRGTFGSALDALYGKK